MTIPGLNFRFLFGVISAICYRLWLKVNDWKCLGNLKSIILRMGRRSGGPQWLFVFRRLPMKPVILHSPLSTTSQSSNHSVIDWRIMVCFPDYLLYRRENQMQLLVDSWIKSLAKCLIHHFPPLMGKMRFRWSRFLPGSAGKTPLLTVRMSSME